MEFMKIVVGFAQSIWFVGIVGAFLLLTKYIADKLAGFDADDLIEEKSSASVGFRRAGLYLGTAIAMYGAVVGQSKGFASDTLSLLTDGVMITVFMIIARAVNDNLIVRGIDNNRAIEKGNATVGIVEAGSYIATGIIAYASVTGEGGPWWSSLAYFVLGQVVLISVMALYEKNTAWSVIDNIRKDNVSAGLMLAGIMISISIVLKGAIAGPFHGWFQDLVGFGISTAAGLVMILIILNKFIDRFFLPGTDIRTEIDRDQNLAAIAIVVSVKIALSFVISAAII